MKRVMCTILITVCLVLLTGCAIPVPSKQTKAPTQVINVNYRIVLPPVEVEVISEKESQQ